MDIEGLKKLAEAATPGPWEIVYRDGWHHAKIVREGEHVNSGAICKVNGNSRHDGKPLETIQFIAAANPQAVLELIGQVESLQQKCNHIMSEHGKRLEEVARLQRELEEARKNAERYQLIKTNCREDLLKMGIDLSWYEPTDGLDSLCDAAIAAREKQG